jgi:hypothetical protein
MWRSVGLLPVQNAIRPVEHIAYRSPLTFVAYRCVHKGAVCRAVSGGLILRPEIHVVEERF